METGTLVGLGGFVLIALLIPAGTLLVVSEAIVPVTSRYALPITIAELALWLGLLALSFQGAFHWRDWIMRGGFLALAAHCATRAYRIVHAPRT